MHRLQETSPSVQFNLSFDVERTPCRRRPQHQKSKTTAERNQTSPRLTELSKLGCVEALPDLRKVGDDAPAAAWSITPKGKALLAHWGGEQ